MNKIVLTTYHPYTGDLQTKAEFTTEESELDAVVRCIMDAMENHESYLVSSENHYWVGRPGDSKRVPIEGRKEALTNMLMERVNIWSRLF